MSFFLKSKPKQDKKRKFPKDRLNNEKQQRIEKLSNNNDDDEEIASEDEEEAEQQNNKLSATFSDDEDKQNPQEKRLRLAKKYLEEIEKEEQNRAEDKNLHSSVSQRLTNEYLDSVGKLRRKIADNYLGIEEENIVYLKHKLHKLSITCLCLSTDSRYVFSGCKNSIVIKWDLSESKAVGTIDCTLSRASNKIERKSKSNRLQIWALAVSTDFKFLAIAVMNTSIQIWCPKTLESLHTFAGHRDLVTALVFRKESHQLYSASRDRAVKVWSLDEMIYVESLFGHQSGVTDIDALNRERAITSGGFDGSIRIWKIAEESQLIYNGHSGNIDLVRLINDENFISAGSDGSICVWSAIKKKPLCTQELAHGIGENGEANWISSIATLLNTDIIASGACDGSIKLWKLGDQFRTISLLFDIKIVGFVNCLSFTKDGEKIIAGIGQEHRLGRWSRIKEAPNCILTVPFNRNKKT